MITDEDFHARLRAVANEFRALAQPAADLPPDPHGFTHKKREPIILNVVPGTSPDAYELAITFDLIEDVARIFGPVSATLSETEGRFCLDLYFVHRDRFDSEQISAYVRAAAKARTTQPTSRSLTVFESGHEYVVPVERRERPLDPDPMSPDATFKLRLP